MLLYKDTKNILGMFTV